MNSITHTHDWRGIDTGRMCANCGEIEVFGMRTIYTGSIISDLQKSVERAEENARTGRCEFEISMRDGHEMLPCGSRLATTFCASCGKELCDNHARKVSMETYCLGCAEFAEERVREMLADYDS